MKVHGPHGSCILWKRADVEWPADAELHAATCFVCKLSRTRRFDFFAPAQSQQQRRGDGSVRIIRSSLLSSVLFFSNAIRISLPYFNVEEEGSGAADEPQEKKTRQNGEVLSFQGSSPLGFSWDSEAKAHPHR